MIAVAKGLLGGVETAVAPATKKDGSSPPFSDTFHDVSANQTNQATKAVTQRALRTGRASSNSKAGDSSSFADSAEQLTAPSRGSIASGKADRSAPAQAVGRVVERDPAGAGEQSGEVALKGTAEIADAIEGQLAASIDVQAKAAPSVTPQTIVNASVARDERVAAKDAAYPTAPQRSGDGSQVVETSAEPGAPGIVLNAAGVRLEGTASGGGTNALASPITQQGTEGDSGGRGNAPQGVPTLFATEQVAPKHDPQTAAATLSGGSSTPLKTLPDNVIQSGAWASAGGAQEVSAPVLLASTSTEGLAGAGSTAQMATGGISSGTASRIGTEPQMAGSQSGGTVAIVGKIPGYGTSRPVQTLASGQSGRSASGSVNAKTVQSGPEDEVSQPMLYPGSGTSTANQSVQVAAGALPGTDASAQVTAGPTADQTVRVVVKEPVGEPEASYVPRGAQASSQNIGQGSRIVPDSQTSKDVVRATSRHADGTQTKSIGTGVPEPAMTQSLTFATGAPWPGAEVTHATVSVTNTGASKASASAAVGPVDPVNQPLRASALQGLVPAAVQTSTLTDNAARAAMVAEDGTTSAVSAPASRIAKAGRDETGVPVAEPENPEDEAGQGGASEAPLVLSAVNHTTTRDIVGSGSLPQAAVVIAAASSLAKTMQPQGAGNGSTPVARERKVPAAETRSSATAGSSTQIEAAPAVSPAHPALAASSATSPGSGAVSTDATRGGLEGIGLSAQSQVVPTGGSLAPAGAEGAPPSSVIAEAPGVHATASMSLHGPDQVPAPLAHTTLSATPTVLEIGVPGGTQGWLKIRAEIGEGGVVQASMSASTHAGQDALRRDLPAMTAFLESEHVPVNLQVTHGGSVAGLADGSGLLKDGGFNLAAGLGPSLAQHQSSSPGSGQGEPALGTATGGSGSGQSGRQPEANDRPASDAFAGGGGTREGSVTADSDWLSPAGYGNGSSANGGSWLNVIA